MSQPEADFPQQVEKKICDLEAKLLAQEHRAVNVLWNYFFRAGDFARDDPRREACSRALIYYVFSSLFPGASSGGGGGWVMLGIAVFSAWIAWQSQQSLETQINVSKEQNRFLEASRIASNVSPLISDLLSELDTQSQVPSAGKRTLSPVFVSRLSVITALCGTYDVSPEDDIVLRLSPERRVILLNLVARNFDLSILEHVDFSYADLRNVRLVEADLTNLDLRYADLSDAYIYKTNFQDALLEGAGFRDVDAVSANFTNADLQGARLDGAKVMGADFTGAKLGACRMNAATDLKDAVIGHELIDVLVDDPQWLDKLALRPPKKFVRSTWVLKPIDGANGEKHRFSVQLATRANKVGK